MKQKITILFLTLACLGALPSLAMVSKESKQWQSEEEKKELFKELNLVYTDKNVWHKYLGSGNILEYGNEELNEQLNDFASTLDEATKGINFKEFDNRTLESLKKSHPLVAELVSTENVAAIAVRIIFKSDNPDYLGKLVIKSTPSIGGFGLFAGDKDKFEKGDPIGEYTGKVGYGHDKSTECYRIWYSTPQNVDEAARNEIVFISGKVDQSFNQMLSNAHPYFLSHPEKESAKEVRAPLGLCALEYRNELAFANNAFGDAVNAECFRTLSFIIETDEDGQDHISVEIQSILRASRTINPGQQILWNYGYSEQTQRYVNKGKVFSDITPDDDRTGCFSCCKVKDGLLMCKKCEQALYCDRGCQVKDWPSHKLYCAKIANRKKISDKK